MAGQDVVIVGDFVYPATIRRRRAKETEARWFSESAPFVVRGGDAGAMPLAVSCMIRDGVAPATRVEFRLGSDGLMADAGAPSDITSVRTSKALASGFGIDRTFPVGRVGNEFSNEAEIYRPILAAHVVASGRDEALAATSEIAGRCLHSGGRVWAPSPQPVLSVDPVRNSPNLAYIHMRDLQCLAFPFHISDTDAAVAHANWMREHPWVHARVPGAPPEEPAVIAVPPDRSQFLLEAAQAVLPRIAEARVANDFGALPLEHLEAWVRFRRNLRDVMAGSIEAVAPAYEALEALHAGTPEITLQQHIKPEDALQTLRSQLEVTVHHWRSYLVRMAPRPMPAEDLESVSGLGR